MNPLKPYTAASAVRIHWAIWALGFVSLLMDVSSELIHSLPPLLLATALAGGAGLLIAARMIDRVSKDIRGC